MKKIVVLFLIIAAVASFAGCSDVNDSVDSDAAAATEATAAQTEIQVSTEIVTEAPTEAPTEEETVDDSWKEVYADYLIDKDYKDFFEYAFVYIDDDDIPELYIHGKSRPASSYVCWVYDNDVYSQFMHINGFEYIERGNLFYDTGIEAGVQGDFVYKINGSETEALVKGTASRLIQGHERFVWNDEDITEDEYNRLREEAFDTSSSCSVSEYLSYDDMLAYLEN